MRKSKSIIFVAILICSVCAAEKRKEKSLLFSPSSYNLGFLESGKKLIFDLKLKNVSEKTVRIISLTPSCGCTEATVLKKIMAPGETAIIKLTIDTTGKIGKIFKSIEIETNVPGDPFNLEIRGTIKHDETGKIDAGIIFKGKCRTCHVGKKVGLMRDEDLYNAVCYICHKEVGKLRILKKAFLFEAIANGKKNTSMPGFLKKQGGPLTRGQIISLVEMINGSR